MECPIPLESAPFDLVHCYGLLYHLRNPDQALEFLSQNTKRLLLLETCVSFGDQEQVNTVNELQTDPTQACSGTGCRPTRPWVFHRLKELFEFVYLPKTQPNHEEFPLDWSDPKSCKAPFSRAVFIAARAKLENPLLVPDLISQQTRHD